MEQWHRTLNGADPCENQGVYLYCFAKAHEELRIADCGLRIAGLFAHEGLVKPTADSRWPMADGRQPTKENLKVLVANGLAAVFAGVCLEDFSAANLQDPDWLVPRALQHEQVIEALLARRKGVRTLFPVLPVRFGAVFSSQEGLAEFLAENSEVIGQFLDHVAEKEEWALKGFLEKGRSSAYLAAADSELAERQRRLPASPGIRYFQEKQLRADIQKKARQWGCQLAQLLEADLDLAQAETRPLKLRDGGDLPGLMILHQALLLPFNAVGDFRARVADLAQRYEEQGVVLEISGPWPPYNFCPSFAEPAP